MNNLALEFLKECNESLSDYESMCGELVDQLIHFYGENRVQILYIRPQSSEDAIETHAEPLGWQFHMVAMIDGVVHDPWYPELVLPPEEYVRAAFAGQHLRWEITA